MKYLEPWRLLRLAVHNGLGQNYDKNNDKPHGKREKEDSFEANINTAVQF